MDNLIRGIKDRFDDEGTFKAALTGGLHLGQTPMEDITPYCTIIPADTPFWTFDDNFETFVIFYYLVSREDSASEILDLYDKMKDCFDDADVVIPDAHLIRFWRVQSSPLEKVDGAWSLTVEYNCQIQRD